MKIGRKVLPLILKIRREFPIDKGNRNPLNKNEFGHVGGWGRVKQECWGENATEEEAWAM